MIKHGLWKKRMLVSMLSFSLAAGWNTALAEASGNSPGLEWDRTFDQVPGEAQQTKDGGYIIIGEGHFGNPNSFVKTDAQGKVVWSKPIAGETVQQTRDGGYIVAVGGGSKVDPTYFLLKTDASGKTQWTSSMKGYVVKSIRQIRETNDGGYIFIGYQSIVKVDSNGKVMWRNDAPDLYSLSSVQQTADGGYLIGGGSYKALRLLKLDASGNVT